LDGCKDSDDEEDEAILNEAAKLPWLTEDEFLQKHRKYQKSFNRVLNEINNHSVFKKLEGKSGRPETPVPNQLMVFLKHLGTEGNGASAPNQQNTFGIGKGSSDVFRRRMMTSILSLRDVCCTWPDAEERRELAKLGEIESDFRWNCRRNVVSTCV